MDIKQYWREVRAEEAEIQSQFAFIISIEDSSRCIVGGRINEVTREQAARLIVEKSARLATEEEIEVFRQDQAKRREKIIADNVVQRHVDLLTGAFNQNPNASIPGKKK